MEKMYNNILVSEDADKNIVIGKVNVCDSEKLKLFRDQLISVFNHKTVHDREINAILFRPGLACDRNSDALIERHRSAITNFDNNANIIYDESVFTSKYIGSILIFTSLLKDLDYEKYDDEMVINFIRYGIFRIEPFDKIWTKYSTKLYDSEKIAIMKTNDLDMHSYDFGALKYAFDEKFINYEIIKIFERGKYGFVANPECGNQITYNSKILSRIKHK